MESKKKKNNSILAKIVFFQEPKKKETFALTENNYDKRQLKKEEEANKKNPVKPKCKKNENILLKKNRQGNIEGGNEKQGKKESNTGKPDNTDAVNNAETGKKAPGPAVRKSLGENLEYMKFRYSIPANGDIILREFDVIFNDKPVSAFLMFYDGMADRNIINNNILQPLMLLSNLNIKSDEKELVHYIRKHLLPQNQLRLCDKFQEVIDEINFGGCGIFVDGCSTAYCADVKGWEHRNVERPNMELVIRGPQEGFNEVLRANTALIRKILKDEDLIAEDIAIGKRSKTACSLMYIKDIANNSLVNEVRRRLQGIKIDYLIDTGELEQFLEDSTYLPTPQIKATERPDRVASALSEGKVAVVMNGSPYVLIMPSTISAMFHTPEDAYVRFPYSNFFRLIRILGVIFALLLPGIYIAITNFHHEMIPTDLLLAIAASREKVPFPSIIEILVMETAFELIREAGIRIPGPIGPTLGIIGALILGQAAVAANIVSPILIIIVAVTGIGSFAIPDFSLAFSFRLLRFAYIALGGLAGLLGITAGLFAHLLIIAESKSFGVPMLAPIGPKTQDSMKDQITRLPIWKQDRRPDFLNPKDDMKQENISRKWFEDQKKNGYGGE